VFLCTRMTGARLVVMYGARRASMFLSFSCPFSSEVNVRKKKKERERTNGQISLHVNEKEPVKESATFGAFRFCALWSKLLQKMSLKQKKRIAITHKVPRRKKENTTLPVWSQLLTSKMITRTHIHRCVGWVFLLQNK
jgi:hypothetical protein